MSQTTILGIAFVLLLASFPLVSLGTWEERPVLWGLGLACLVVGGLIPPGIRFWGPKDEDDDDEAKGEDGEASKEAGASYVNYGSSEPDAGSGVVPGGRPTREGQQRVEAQREHAEQIQQEPQQTQEASSQKDVKRKANGDAEGKAKTSDGS